ncbi:MAG: 50S ribosomal protein L18 [Deltaproteobacteria bacterium]|nr:50S ribosomal protein L18 [Deltaproteobacteria bacterium]MBI4196463.1 50S ribosomal protein L18 [Deltaproteobacteria bacterium]
MSNNKAEARVRRHQRLRKKVSGTKEMPRLSLYRSLSNLYAQLIDDEKSVTLLGLSTKSKECAKIDGGNISGARQFGLLFAKRAKEKDLCKAVFDRGGWMYHGRVKAFADGVREGGVKI